MLFRSLKKEHGVLCYIEKNIKDQSETAEGAEALLKMSAVCFETPLVNLHVPALEWVDIT